MKKINILKRISNMANKLDEKGLTKLADEIDDILKDSSDVSDPESEEEFGFQDGHKMDVVFDGKEEDSKIFFEELERVKSDFLNYARENDFAGDETKIFMSVARKGTPEYNFAVENGFVIAIYCEI